MTDPPSQPQKSEGDHVGAARDVGSIRRPARRAERRIRFSRALGAATTSLCVGLVLAAVAIALRKTGHVNELTTRLVVALAVAQVAFVGTLAYLRPLAARAGAVA